MEEVAYKGIMDRLKISIENLYEDSEYILNQIEEGINTLINPSPIVGYQGVPGAYGEEAATSYFQERWTACIQYEEFEDILQALEKGEIDYGVLPIENSSAGEVLDTYDLIKKYDLHIVGEQIVKVDHKLLGIPGTTLEQIKEVYSHPQALSQCKEFLKENKVWTQRAYVNTAAACQYVAEAKEYSKVAIGSERAARLYGLEVLKEKIQFNTNNFTRFIVLSQKMHITKACNKVSIIFATEHISGSLYNILGHFAYNGLNLLKIHSRPLLEKKWEYYFFADLEGNLQDASVLIALSKIRQQSSYFKILGNYVQGES